MPKSPIYGPKVEQISRLDRTLESATSAARPFIELGKGAVHGAIEGWKKAKEYQAMQREVALLEVEDFCDVPHDAE